MKIFLRERGFTLMEMIVAVIILAIISIGTLMFTKPVIQLWGNQNFHQGPAMEARLGLMRMVREMDQLKDIKSILTANAATYSFIDGGDQTITYIYSSGILTRRVGNSGQPNRNFITRLSTFTFTYKDKDNGALVTPTVGSGTATNIRTIGIASTVAIGSWTSQISATAHPRNVLQ